MKVISYLKDHPESGLSRLLSGVFTLLGRNRIRAPKGNRIILSNAYLKKCRIEINGTGNTVDFGGAASYLSGCTVHIDGNGNTVRLGRRNVLSSCEFWMEDDGNAITMGNHNRVMGRTHLAVLEGTEISFGDECLFSSDVIFRTSDSHSILDASSGERINPASSISVGDRVWLGNRTTVLKGVRIGNDAIIGTGAVVTSDVAEGSVAAGNPARQVRSGVKWTIERKSR